MRNAFVRALVEMADRDPSIVLLTGDLGYTVLEPFADRFPDRFFNVGVAEQNMLGIATYEFIRNGPVLHELPVRIVGVGGGLDYGHNGPTHYALEDVALMRVQPGLAVIAPADPLQTRSALLATDRVAGPAYFRLGKDSAEIPALGGRFRLGRAELIGVGRDAAIVTYGAVAAAALASVPLLREQGVEVTVAVTACLSPTPADDLAELLARVPVVVTVESHYTVGGLGSLVCEIVAERGIPCRVVRRGVQELPSGATGDMAYLHDRHGLSARSLADATISALSLIG